MESKSRTKGFETLCELRSLLFFISRPAFKELRTH